MADPLEKQDLKSLAELPTIGERIQYARKLRGLTQLDLTKLCDLKAQAAVSGWENNRVAPSDSSIKILSEKLEIPWWWFKLTASELDMIVSTKGNLALLRGGARDNSVVCCVPSTRRPGLLEAIARSCRSSLAR